MMMHDITIADKKYRAFWEDTNMSHPEGPAGLIYNLTDHIKVWDYTGLLGESVEDVERKVRARIEGLNTRS